MYTSLGLRVVGVEVSASCAGTTPAINEPGSKRPFTARTALSKFTLRASHLLILPFSLRSAEVSQHRRTSHFGLCASGVYVMEVGRCAATRPPGRGLNPRMG